MIFFSHKPSIFIQPPPPQWESPFPNLPFSVQYDKIKDFPTLLSVSLSCTPRHTFKLLKSRLTSLWAILLLKLKVFNNMTCCFKHHYHSQCIRTIKWSTSSCDTYHTAHWFSFSCEFIFPVHTYIMISKKVIVLGIHFLVIFSFPNHFTFCVRRMLRTGITHCG